MCITALTLTACNGDNSVMMPDSIGNAYDVTLVTKDKRLCNVALDILDTVMPAMTQHERLFTILTFNSHTLPAHSRHGETDWRQDSHQIRT